MRNIKYGVYVKTLKESFTFGETSYRTNFLGANFTRTKFPSPISSILSKFCLTFVLKCQDEFSSPSRILINFVRRILSDKVDMSFCTDIFIDDFPEPLTSPLLSCYLKIKTHVISLKIVILHCVIIQTPLYQQNMIFAIIIFNGNSRSWYKVITKTSKHNFCNYRSFGYFVDDIKTIRK